MGHNGTVPNPVKAREPWTTGLMLMAIIVAVGGLVTVGSAGLHLGRLAPTWVVSITDMLLSGVLSAFLIHVWIFRPTHALARKNSLFATVLDQLDTGVLITDNRQEDNPIVYINPAFLRITGYDESEVIGRNPRFLKGPESIPEVAHRISRSIRDRAPVEAIQKNYRKDGSWYWNEMKISPVLDAQGRAAYYVGLSNQVTQRVEMEQRLRELAQAAQQAGEAIVVVHRDGSIEFANPAFCQQTGYALSELQALGADYYIGGGGVFPPEVRKNLEAGRRWEGRHLFPRKDGSGFDCLSSISPVRSTKGVVTHYVGVHRDVTELVALEGRLMQAKKMEAIGTLAGGIAHDFNNILASMLGNLYMVRRSDALGEKAAARLELVETQGYRAADMIKQLLAFARKGKVKRVSTSLDELLKEAVQAVSVNLPAGIRLSYEQAPHAHYTVLGDPSLLLQAVINLVHNARDALQGSDDAHIDIRLDQADAAADGLADLLREAGVPKSERYARIRVGDNGHGMDREVMERIFDPFYTTKALGQGTGLGMAMVKGCVDMHKGYIGVTSERGKGTEFTIVLPIDVHAALQQGDAGVTPQAAETILVAEEDEGQRQSMKQMLADMGYTVVLARQGAELARICNRMSERPALAVIDMDMAPGYETAVSAIWERLPGLPLLLTSRRDGHAGGQQWWPSDSAIVVHKPVQADALSMAVHALVDRARDGDARSGDVTVAESIAANA